MRTSFRDVSQSWASLDLVKARQQRGAHPMAYCRAGWWPGPGVSTMADWHPEPTNRAPLTPSGLQPNLQRGPAECSWEEWGSSSIQSPSWSLSILTTAISPLVPWGIQRWVASETCQLRWGVQLTSASQWGWHQQRRQQQQGKPGPWNLQLQWPHANAARIILLPTSQTLRA